VSEVYNGDNREHGREIVRLIHDELAPRLRGQDLSDVERIWERLFALTHASRDRKTLLEAIACVDCAIWDLVGTAALCAEAGVKMAHHEEPQIARHLLAAVPHGTYVECFAGPERDPAWQALWANRPAVEDGAIETSDDPGFGLVLDETIVRRYRVA
jgi:L-alanine-DL-glutamate epimerase-like enolase superfamily enzyme